MHPDTRKISEHMKDFGLHVLGKAVVDVIFSEYTSPYSHAMGVVRCAHAAELIIKSRIAEEHPLLIFEVLPKAKDPSGKVMDVSDLLRDGKTIMYSELPNVLWASTGVKVPDIARFNSFGKLRNTITHLAVPDADLVMETLSFSFLVIEPLIRQFWNVDIVDYMQEYDADCDEILDDHLSSLGISRKKRHKSKS